jgi:hypothetical protein
MQFADVTVRLSGDINFSIEKANVSVAEIMLLRAIHGGEDAVTNIRPTAVSRGLAAKKIKDDMLQKYAGTSGEPLIEKMFPGIDPRLPKTLKDIGLELDLETLDARKRGGAKSVKIEVEDDEADDGSTYAAEDARRADKDD